MLVRELLMDNNEVNTFRYVTVFSVHLDMSSEVSKKPSQKYQDSSQHFVKGSPHQTHFIFEIIVGKGRIRFQ